MAGPSVWSSTTTSALRLFYHVPNVFTIPIGTDEGTARGNVYARDNVAPHLAKRFVGVANAGFDVKPTVSALTRDRHQK